MSRPTRWSEVTYRGVDYVVVRTPIVTISGTVYYLRNEQGTIFVIDYENKVILRNEEQP